MTRIHYDGVALEMLVRRADAIFVGRPLDPPERVEMVSILPEGSDFEGRNDPPYFEPDYHDADPGPHANRNYPPYRRVWYRFEVAEVFKPHDALAAGATVEVCEGESAFQESLHRGFYLDGKRKSPIYERYEAQAAMEAGAPRVVFAMRQLETWGLPAIDAFEGVGRRAEVEQLLG